ncbi:AsmA family protein [Williamwhitmania taraxaci]|uniref:AsmA-like C-terminal region n=1 Tax=Williamwhitmania taraxaci TaxID=1640674 RepID=A0A1G6SYJ3_9BACT|nr:AsmA-like C-terminal region-containing protein [Williamwhitmania taraxaci]SDD21297.1 AsmA-like C-terminal region [Williamwhitmania taraxaci]
MKKFLKIFLKSLGIFLGVVILAMILIPLLFKSQIISKAESVINENVNATVTFSDVSLSLFRDFPNLSIALKDLSVVGIDKFKDDTLVAFSSFNLSVNLGSVISGDQIKVNSISLNNPKIYAKVLADSSANWDIAKPSAPTPETPVDTSAASPFKLSLKEFIINNGNIVYEDQTSNMIAGIKNLNFRLGGNLSDEITTLDINSSIENLAVMMGGTTFVQNMMVTLKAKVSADLKNMVFTIQDNEIGVNKLVLGVNGSIAMPDSSMVFDLKYFTKETSFKTLLSMVPSVFMKDYETLKTDGKLSLDGTVTGTYNSKQLPNVGLKLLVSNARVQYPILPKAIEGINIDLNVDFNGSDDSKTLIDLRKFTMSMAGNPISAKAQVRTPMTDPQVSAAIDGKVNFTTLADVVPMENVAMKGIMTANVNMAVRMSQIEKEEYDNVKVDGLVELQNFEMKTPDLPADVKIPSSKIQFTPKYLQLDHFNCLIGKSDLSLKGRVENFLGYVFKSGVLKANFDLSSNLLDANEFMSEDATPETAAVADTTPMKTVFIPQNIDFTLNTSLKKVLFDKMEMTNVGGDVVLKGGKAIMDKLHMNLFNGSMMVTGTYNTADTTKPSADMDLDIKNLDIQMATKSFSMIEKMAPITKNCQGNISLKFTFKTDIDQEMSPVLKSIDGYGKLQSQNLQVVNSKTFDQINKVMKAKGMGNTIKDVNISFTIKDGWVNVAPSTLMIDDIALTFGGRNGLDQTLDYNVDLVVPSKYFGDAASKLASSLLSKTPLAGKEIKMPEKINVKLKVDGMVTDPKVKLAGMSSGAPGEGNTSAKETLKETVKETAKEEVKKYMEENKEDIEKKKKEAADKAKEELKKKLKGLF